MGLVRLTSENWAQYGKDVMAIEADAEYPLGQDSFRIDHGANYFAFFERLGRLYYYGWIEAGKVVGVAAGILREWKTDSGKQRAWYLCDLKVHPEYRGQHIPLRMLSAAFPLNYLRCTRGYAISMDPANGRTNRIALLLRRFRWLRFVPSEQIQLWSLSYEEMERALPVLRQHRGPLSFLSLRGIKDIVLKSTKKPMPLLHAQFGPFAANGVATPEPGAVHMFCAPRADAMATELMQMGFSPSASATVISHRMSAESWCNVLTSEI